MATSSEPSPTHTAIVIGAGPSGLSTSIGLSHRGWNVILIEKHDSFPIRGASFGMAKNGIQALNEIYPNIVQDRMIDTHKAIPLPNGSLVLPWWMMRDALLEQVREEETEERIELLMGCYVVEIVDEEEREMVTVRLSNGTSVEGHVVIGADGVHSSIRDLLGLPPNEKTGTKIFRGTVEIPLPESEDTTQQSTSHSSSLSSLQPLLQKGMVPISTNYPEMFFFVLNFHPHIPGRICWVLSTTDPNFDTKKKEEDDTMTLPSLIERKEQMDVEKRELIQSIFCASTEEACCHYTETKVTDFSEEVLSQFNGRWGGRGRVTLIGDAAHAMRPTDGQGGNMAFEDVVVLCRILSTRDDDVNDGPSTSSQSEETTSSIMANALETFERTRLPRVQKMHENQRLRYEARMRGEKVLPWSDEFKEWVTNGV